MDPRGNIYAAPEDQIPAEDKARLEGYLRGKAEAMEGRMRCDPRDIPVTASLDPKVAARLFMGLGPMTACYVNEDDDATWEWQNGFRLTLSTETMHWHFGLTPPAPKVDPAV